MVESPLDIYSDAFIARGRFDLETRPTIQTTPGIRGVALIRLLVTDDSGYERLVAELAGPWRGVAMVFERAERCHELVRNSPGWNGHSEMAMVHRDIRAMTSASLPDGLRAKPVNTAFAQSLDGVTPEGAAAVAVASDPDVPDSPAGVAAFVKGMPASVSVFAAVDAEGIAHATAACQVFGEYAQVFFVNTEPAWRRRGIAMAMTFEALRAAAALGVQRAFLHATEDGLPVYRRLGFEEAGMVTRFSYAEPGPA